MNASLTKKEKAANIFINKSHFELNHGSDRSAF